MTTNFISKTDRIFQETLNEILVNGISTEGHKIRPVYKDGVPAHTVYINQVVEKYDIDKGEFPITTLRPIAWKSSIKEMFWIYQKASNELSVLEEEFGIHWWREWEVNSTGTIGQRYGATVKRYDLMNKLLNGLKNEPYTRRHIIDLYQYADFEETEGLNPCAFLTVWSARGEYLDLTLHQRSSDYCTAGHINKIQYVALMMMVSKHVGLKPGVFMHVVDNLHIYDRHIDQAKELISRTPSEKQPKLILKEGKTNFYDFTIDDFEMIDYEPVKPQLKFDLGI